MNTRHFPFWEPVGVGICVGRPPLLVGVGSRSNFSGAFAGPDEGLLSSVPAAGGSGLVRSRRSLWFGAIDCLPP